MMLTAAALSAYLTARDCVPRDLVPVMTAIAMHESGGDTLAVHRNPNGTVDYGIAQINSSNFGWTGLTPPTVFDICANVRAGARVLLAKYNGSPPDAVKAAYSADVLARMMAQSAQPKQEADDPRDPKPPAWDMEAVAAWRWRHDPPPEAAAEASAVKPSSLPVIASKDPK